VPSDSTSNERDTRQVHFRGGPYDSRAIEMAKLIGAGVIMGAVRFGAEDSPIAEGELYLPHPDEGCEAICVYRLVRPDLVALLLIAEHEYTVGNSAS
jgi:hypothetical protein